MARITLTDGSAQDLPPASELAASNCGTPGVWRFEGARPGPHVAITALVHGNEVCGAWAVSRLLASKPAPPRGRLTLAFCNLQAYAKLDDANKDECRLLDEDLNRVWGRVDSPPADGDTREMRRAREILPFVQDADVLLDLHSMTEAAPALGLVGLAQKNVAFARRIGFPALLVRDAGHASGLRLIDRAPFGDAAAAPVAMLVECGAHFSRAALDAASEAVRRTVAVCIDGNEEAPAAPQSIVEVTEAVTIRSPGFAFVEHWPNMGVVPRKGTLIARDGDTEVRTPYDDTWLVMPATERFRQPGQTAVRFGRRVGA
jgi:succinylglutamate desuccinylase